MEQVGFVLGGIRAQEAPVLFLDLLSSLGNAEKAHCLSLWALFSPYKERSSLTILPTSVCKLPLSLGKPARLSPCCAEIFTHEIEEVDVELESRSKSPRSEDSD